MRIYKFVITAAVAVAALNASFTSAFAQDEKEKPIKIVVTGITDADFIANVFSAYIEKQGYKVDRVKADYAAQFVGIEAGDMDISTSIWETIPEIFLNAVATGKVLNMGSTRVKIREGWWFPSYMKEICPGLPDWKALLEPACIKALSTPETAPKAAYIEAPADWTTNNAQRIEAFKLPFELISAGTPAAMHAAFVGAMQRKEPVIGWGFTPDWMPEQFEGEFVEFPPYSEECVKDPKWGINPDKTWDCDNSRGYVWKVMNTESEKRLPKLARTLRLFQLTAADVAWGIRRVDLDGISSEEAGREWIEAHPDLVADWGL